MTGGAAVLSLALVLGPIVGPLTPVDPSTSVGAVFGDQTDPSLAASSTSLFVVWTDRRQGQRVYGAIINASAAPTVAGSFALSASNLTAGAAAGFDGANFLAVWSEFTGVSYDVVAARLSPAGIALDPPVVIAGGPGDQLQPALSFDGTRYLVAWNEWDGAVTHVRSSLVAVNPGISAAASVQLNGTGGLERSRHPPAVAFDGTRYLVAFALRGSASVRDTRARRVTTSGSVEGAVIDLGTTQYDEDRPTIAARTGEFLVAWYGLAQSNSESHFKRVRSDGTIVDTSGVKIGPNNAGSQRPSVLFDATAGNWVALFAQSTGVHAQRFSLTGASLDGTGVLLTPVSWTHGAAVAIGANLFIVWEDFASASYPRPATGVDLYVSRLARPPALIDVPVAITVASSAQTLLCASTTDDGGLIAYNDYATPLAEVRAVAVSSSGSVGAPGILSHPDAGMTGMDIAANGTSTLAYYQTDLGFATNEYVRGVNVVTPVTPALSMGTNDYGKFARLAAAANGRFLVARRPTSGTAIELSSFTFPISGGGVTRAMLRTAGTGAPRDVAPACIGARCVAVFEVTSTSGLDLMIAEVDAVAAGGADVALPAAGAQSRPSVATNGLEFALAFAHRAQADGGYEIRAARFGFGETALRAETLIEGPIFVEPSPVSVWDGASFWVLWVDASSRNIRAVRMHGDGGVATPGGMALFGTGEETAVKAAAAGTPGTMIVAVERFEASRGAQRVFVSTLRDAPGPAGSPCATAADCTVAFCAEGTCCPTACGAGSSCATGQCVSADGGAAPDSGVEDAGLSSPDGGGTVLPDGGGILLDDGGILLPDGGLLLSDGGVVNPHPSRMIATVGCDCGAASGWPLSVMLLLFAAARRRARSPAR